MKKILVLLGMFCSMLTAQQDGQVSLPPCMNFKEALLMHWKLLPCVYKMLVVGLAAVLILWIAWRIMYCGKGGCGCKCLGNCQCTL